MLIDLNEDTLAELVAKNEKVVVQYSASWCGNCRIMKPKFKKLASENEAIAFVLVDAENAPESRKLANVSNLPTFATFVTIIGSMELNCSVSVGMGEFGKGPKRKTH